MIKINVKNWHTKAGKIRCQDFKQQIGFEITFSESRNPVASVGGLDPNSISLGLIKPERSNALWLVYMNVYF